MSLNNSISRQEASLFDRLGGQSVFDAALDEFYFRLVCDEELLVFFEGADTSFLKAHQRQFLTFAFMEIPKNVDVATKISAGHARMFQMGISEVHFDLVADHLMETLLVLGIKQELIGEVLANVAPVRAVFEGKAVKESKHLTVEAKQSFRKSSCLQKNGRKTRRSFGQRLRNIVGHSFRGGIATV